MSNIKNRTSVAQDGNIFEQNDALTSESLFELAHTAIPFDCYHGSNPGRVRNISSGISSSDDECDKSSTGESPPIVTCCRETCYDCCSNGTIEGNRRGSCCTEATCQSPVNEDQENIRELTR